MKTAPRPEINLLLLCARTPLDGYAEQIVRLLHRELDWKYLILLARRHGLTPLLSHSLNTVGVERVPAHALGELRRVSEASGLRNLLFASELVRVLSAFDAEGIAAVPYKGPALAVALYQNLSLRQFDDLDLLLRQKDATRGRQILGRLGYRPSGPGPGLAGWVEAAFVGIHCSFGLQNHEKRVDIEINWRLAPWYYRLPAIPESTWTAAGQLPFAGGSVPWPVPEDLLFLLYMHGSLHIWELLKWIVDIAQLLRTHRRLDMPAVIARAHEAKCGRMLALALFMASDLLDAPLPPAAVDYLKQVRGLATLAEEIYDHLFAETLRSHTLSTKLSSLSRISERLDAKLFYRALPVPYFLLHRVVRPGIAAWRRANA